MKTVALDVNGMNCGGCAAGVRKALGALPGVEDVSVSLADRSVDVKYDERRGGVEEMRDALRSAGYEVARATAGLAKARGCCCS